LIVHAFAAAAAAATPAGATITADYC
jgi:hypothetical protein